MGCMRTAYEMLVEKREVKTLGCILKENIKMDHKEIERDCVD